MTILATQNSSVLNRSHGLAKGLRFIGLPGLGFRTGYELRDLSGHHNHGTFQNGCGWGGESYSGGFGSTTHDGINDHIDLTTFDLPRPGTHCIWFKANTVGTGDSQPTLFKSGSQILAIDGANNQLQFNSGGWRNSTGVITLGKWHFAVYSGYVTVGQGNSKMYLDAAKVYDAAVAMNLVSGGTEIGARADALSNPLTLDGNVGGVMLYDRVLTETEVRDLYFESMNGFPRLLNRRKLSVSSVAQAAGFPFIQYYAGSGVSL